MGSIGFFKTRGDPNPLIVDAAMESEHTHSASVTASPVEVGADVADHRRLGPVRYRFRAYFQDDPFDPQAAQEAIRGRQELDEITAVIDKTRAVGQRARLLEFFNGSDPFVVITELDQYEDMVFEGELKTRKVGGGTYSDGSQSPATLEVSGMLVQLTFAETRTTTGVKVAPRVTQAHPTKAKGAVAPKPATEAVKSKSMAATIYDWAVK